MLTYVLYFITRTSISRALLTVHESHVYNWYIMFQKY